MNLLRLFTVVVPLIVLLPNLSGCIVFNSTKDVQITVRDRTTKAPIEGASLTIRYFTTAYWYYHNPPANVEWTTDANGQAVIPVVNFPRGNVKWIITAPGYGLEGGFHSRDHIPYNFRTDRKGYALIEMFSHKDHQKWLQKMRARWPEDYKQFPPKKE